MLCLLFMDPLVKRLLCLVFIVCQIHGVESRRCKTKPPTNVDRRPGRCPHPQYAFSGLSCLAEGNDTACPWNYKCCPLTNGMNCFAPCPEWSKPCKIQCPFGQKVDPSPCTSCECAEDPCLSKQCPRGASCVVVPYQPCAVPNQCGFTATCVRNSTNDTNPIVKPKKCPDYWPMMRDGGGNLLTCSVSDSDCPDEQKCCPGPPPFRGEPTDTFESYCVDPCEDISQCTLNCPFGLRVDGACRVCECIPDPCSTMTCPAGQKCQALPAPCYHYAGSPPCRLLPVCMGA